MQRYAAVSGMSQTTGEAQNPAQAYGTAVDALIQIIGIIGRANGNSPLQRNMNCQAAVLATMRHFASEAAARCKGLCRYGPGRVRHHNVGH